ACTGIDNIAEAITLLEQNNWDLVVESSAFCPVVPVRGAVVERQPRMLNFCVEYRSTNVDVVLEESSSVGEIKQILETELHVPVSRMQLKGWKTGDVTDSTVLRSLHLPKNNSLYVLTPDIAPTATTSQSGALQESLNQNFLLVISHHEAQRDYSLNFPGSKTIQEYVHLLLSVSPGYSHSYSNSLNHCKKKHIRPHEHPCPTSAMGRLACHCQRRLGRVEFQIQDYVKGDILKHFPDLLENVLMTLAVAGISFPCHRLTVCRRTSPAHTQEQTEECTDVHMVSDSEGDDFEDASEFGVDEGEIFGMGTSASRKSPMMPENAENEGDALLHFTAEFSSRYGECHPVFFIGSLEAAFQETFYGKARDRKPLAIYLHHDDSVLTNVFCSQMLCAESIVSYLSQNFITWAWDMTKEANRARLLTMCTRHFGSVVAQTIRTYKTDQFPLLLIVMGKRSSNEVLNVIQGNTTVDELMMRLMAAMEIFTAQQQEDIRDEDEREARELVKREQDEAYRVSLEADRAKREAQEREMAEQVRLEQIRKEQEDEREAIRLSLEQALPPEPEEEGSEPISKLRIRTPSGEFLERRFLGSCKLQVLFDFVASKGFPWEEFKLLTTFPRRNVTQLDPTWSLVEAKLFPQETLFLEAKE
ncbi:FAS-associated factor 1, partial [Acipenser ruthenus]